MAQRTLHNTILDRPLQSPRAQIAPVPRCGIFDYAFNCDFDNADDRDPGGESRRAEASATLTGRSARAPTAWTRLHSHASSASSNSGAAVTSQGLASCAHQHRNMGGAPHFTARLALVAVVKRKSNGRLIDDRRSTRGNRFATDDGAASKGTLGLIYFCHRLTDAFSSTIMSSIYSEFPPPHGQSVVAQGSLRRCMMCPGDATRRGLPHNPVMPHRGRHDPSPTRQGSTATTLARLPLILSCCHVPLVSELTLLVFRRIL